MLIRNINTMETIADPALVSTNRGVSGEEGIMMLNDEGTEVEVVDFDEVEEEVLKDD